MRVLLLLGALWLIVAAAVRWDRLHPLRTAASDHGTGAADDAAADGGPSGYLDFGLLERRLNGRRATPHPRPLVAHGAPERSRTA